MDMPCTHRQLRQGVRSRRQRTAIRGRESFWPHQVDYALGQQEGRQVWRVLLWRGCAAGDHLRARLPQWLPSALHRSTHSLAVQAAGLRAAECRQGLTETTCRSPWPRRLARCGSRCRNLHGWHSAAGCLCTGHTPAGPPRAVKLMASGPRSAAAWSAGLLLGCTCERCCSTRAQEPGPAGEPGRQQGTARACLAELQPGTPASRLEHLW